LASRERAAFLLREQSRACADYGSPLYAELLARAAEDAQAGGVVFELLAPHDAPNLRADALALRLMAAVHRLVLEGAAPDLAACYPSAGGKLAAPGAWGVFRELLRRERGRLACLVARPCQTNEVGRAAALAFGFFQVSFSTALPLRLLEVGCSAGLNLRWDHYRYGGGGGAWGPRESPVDLRGLWGEAPLALPAAVPIAERSGCDPRPVDLGSPDGRLDLVASLWADQVERVARLRGAIAVAARVAASLERASVRDWLPGRLAAPVPGVATVVFHSIVQEYLSTEERRFFHGALEAAGGRATREASLHWLRLEPFPEPPLRYAVTLTSWPGAAERIVAWAGPHGSDVRRA
jgi:hypothetical protein